MVSVVTWEEWRARFMAELREAFPVSRGAVRWHLIVALARARTPGEASIGIHDAAEALNLSEAERQEISTIVNSLMVVHMKQAE
jgi:hypothetical protein